MITTTLTNAISSEFRTIVTSREMVSAINYAIKYDANGYGAGFQSKGGVAEVDQLINIYLRIYFDRETIFDVGAIIACLTFKLGKNHNQVLSLQKFHEKLLTKHNLELFNHGLIAMEIAERISINTNIPVHRRKNAKELSNKIAA